MRVDDFGCGEGLGVGGDGGGIVDGELQRNVG